MNLFKEKSITKFLQDNDENIIQDLLRKGNLETVDVDQLATLLADKNKIKELKIDKEKMTVIPKIGNISGRCLNQFLGYEPNQTYPVAIVTCNVPYSGNEELFKIQPNKFSSHSQEARTDRNILSFEINTTFGDYTDEAKKYIKDQITMIMHWIQSNLDDLTEECTTYNHNLRNMIKIEIDNRIDEIKERNQLSNELNPFK